MGDIVLVLDVFSALLVLVALSRPVAARLSLTPVVLLAAIGVTISGASGALLRLLVPHWFGGFERLFADLPLPSEIFIYVFRPLLVFEAAAPILVLAVIATLVAAGIVGVALWPLAGPPLAVCLLLGAVLSTTDPAAVIAIFREVGAPARLTRGLSRGSRSRYRAADRRTDDDIGARPVEFAGRPSSSTQRTAPHHSPRPHG